MRQNEARQVRARIAELERNLTGASPLPGRQHREKSGNELRNAKFRLDRLEECIAAMR
ncbi:hypothetical protein [Mesorhizobium erdmanii]|uniref:hypothetical protein n=1 Tax=Mesorhizobium erdmanii TaxID=1777866 RepID=UPI001FD7507C|nr:hypothetical protein [Mesorhizobium erdmanii]